MSQPVRPRSGSTAARGRSECERAEDERTREIEPPSRKSVKLVTLPSLAAVLAVLAVISRLCRRSVSEEGNAPAIDIAAAKYQLTF